MSVRKPNTVSYPELSTEIHHHIDAEKTSNLEASKLNQDIFLGGGKRRLDSQAKSFRQDGNDNGKKSKNAENGVHSNNARDNHDNRGGTQQA